MLDTVMTLSYLKRPPDAVNYKNDDRNKKNARISNGELQLLAMSEASKDSDEEFLLAFERGVLNELQKCERHDKKQPRDT